MHYLDHAASSPLRPEVLELYRGTDGMHANAASVHAAGRAAKLAIEQAREQVAESLGADGAELIFTGSGTEAINLAIQGTFWRRRDVGRVVLVPEGEHHATQDTVEWLERHQGAQPVWVPLERDGRIRLAAWQQALDEHAGEIALATAIWVNNEIGTVQPVAELARSCADAGVPLHLDAVAAYGHVPIELRKLRAASGSGSAGLVLLSISAHKIGGPQGIGALFAARAAQLEPLLHGGGQQRRLRAGTEDALGSLGFAAAAAGMITQFDAEHERHLALAERLRSGLASAVPQARINGAGGTLGGDAAWDVGGVPNILNVSIPGCESDSLLFLLDQAGIAVSSGSACQAGVTEVSHVIRALGYSEPESRGSLRVSFGPESSVEDVDALLDALPSAARLAQQAGLAARRTRFDDRGD